MVPVSVLQVMMAHWRMWDAVIHIYTATALGESRVVSPTVGGH